ncbi:Photosynthetic reaction center cytochrome C subunit [Granulicella pectinivorans]|uniref:Photosynthetic reaction center cytochrome c subunit n=1 Tax=Granulicella pectinivorans TaxID=474950 RepID=A0A1I6MDS2_9BACT|nr:c-type cytochrome [Granulicella pectinivorans]SFS13845.1 Photosynthetic reaction center cytochrome C subunit [Granulicella pectinivorans]
MNGRYGVALLLGCVTFGVAAFAATQGPGSTSAKHEDAKAAYPRPTNLKVLSKTISGEDLDKLMHRFKEDLGVPCGYCHEENPETKQINYASDENPIKETARFMIKMNEDINTKYLGQLGDRRYAEPLTCGNCHQGQVDPPTFQPKEQR